MSTCSYLKKFDQHTANNFSRTYINITELKNIVFLCPTIVPCRSIHLSHFMTELKIPHHPYTTHDDFNNADPTVTQDTCRSQLMTLFLFTVRSRKSVDRACHVDQITLHKTILYLRRPCYGSQTIVGFISLSCLFVLSFFVPVIAIRYLSSFNVLAIFWDVSCHPKVCYFCIKFCPHKNIPSS